MKRIIGIIAVALIFISWSIYVNAAGPVNNPSGSAGGSTTAPGILQLVDSVTSTSVSSAATPSAVKATYDRVLSGQSAADVVSAITTSINALNLASASTHSTGYFEPALGFTPYNSTNPDGYISSVTWTAVTSKPTPSCGEGTALGKLDFDNSIYTCVSSTLSAEVSFAAITGKPTTLSGYGITDALASSWTPTWGQVQNKPASAATHTCSGTDKMSAYDANAGLFTCTTDSTGGSGGGDLYSTGTYTDPSWITELAGTKISGYVPYATYADNGAAPKIAGVAGTLELASGNSGSVVISGPSGTTTTYGIILPSSQPTGTGQSMVVSANSGTNVTMAFSQITGGTTTLGTSTPTTGLAGLLYSQGSGSNLSVLTAGTNISFAGGTISATGSAGTPTMISSGTTTWVVTVDAQNTQNGVLVASSGTVTAGNIAESLVTNLVSDLASKVVSTNATTTGFYMRTGGVDGFYESVNLNMTWNHFIQPLYSTVTTTTGDTSFDSSAARLLIRGTSSDLSFAPTGTVLNGDLCTYNTTSKSIDCITAASEGGMVYPNAGIPKSTGSAWTASAYTDITALWTTCSGYLKSDGTCDTPSSSGTPTMISSGTSTWPPVVVDVPNTQTGIVSVQSGTTSAISTWAALMSKLTGTPVSAQTHTCSGTDKLSAYDANAGLFTCTTDSTSTGGTGMEWPASAGLMVYGGSSAYDSEITSWTGLETYLTGSLPWANISATYTNIKDLWTTCTSGYLAFDGSCGVPTTVANISGGAAGEMEYQTGVGSTGFTNALPNAIMTSSSSTVPTFATALPNGITATTQSAGDNSTKVATTAYGNALVSDATYSTDWNGVTGISPSKNAVYDKMQLMIPKTQVFSKCFTALAVTATSDFAIEQPPSAITITAVHVYQNGATNVIGGLDECTGTAGVCSSVTAVDADITGTDGAQVADDGSLTNAGIAAGNRIKWHTTSVSGTNTDLNVCYYYTID